jgi:hypothetical protein
MRFPRVMIAYASGLMAGSVACTSAPSGLVDDLVVLYGVGHRDGEASLDVYADGRVIARVQIHDAIAERRVQIEATELEALRRTLAEHRCCSLRSRRETGVPDEARPSLAIRWAGEDCKVQMWDNEWSGDPHAKACLRAVEDLHGRAMKSPMDDGDTP